MKKDLLKTPYELWTGRQPNLSHFKVWGCTAHVKNIGVKRKFDSRTEKHIFLGYEEGTKGYRFINPEHDSITISRDAVFLEDEPGSVPKKGRVDEELFDEEIEDSREDAENVVPALSLRRSTRERKEPYFFFLIENEGDPKSVGDALSRPDKELWRKAINAEIQSIMDNKTWCLVDPPKGIKPIGSKWILQKKFHPDGTINKYKARLVVKGFAQRVQRN